ncbi:MAG: UDP-N-acetylglucosamine--N-acetylmuramyl-(pentapeptide) pyrophosphoryl-undecaprenol N-acetylglucosamine transferase, partial [Dinghuibacter sp.]|nr:UDP-N-acetylglucosamine--N-acetylmuramyl-(pentapeptide) pyrophosphoryl-undecaprenol N-acetylglucosamine transferase [Dinghuibacter sp.]
YPFAAEDHQTANAMNLVNQQAAVMVKDTDVAARLVNTVLELAANEARQQELAVNIKKLGISDADERIATEILQALHV